MNSSHAAEARLCSPCHESLLLAASAVQRSDAIRMRRPPGERRSVTFSLCVMHDQPRRGRLELAERRTEFPRSLRRELGTTGGSVVAESCGRSLVRVAGSRPEKRYVLGFTTSPSRSRSIQATLASANSGYVSEIWLPLAMRCSSTGTLCRARRVVLLVAILDRNQAVGRTVERHRQCTARLRMVTKASAQSPLQVGLSPKNPPRASTGAGRSVQCNAGSHMRI